MWKKIKQHLMGGSTIIGDDNVINENSATVNSGIVARNNVTINGRVVVGDVCGSLQITGGRVIINGKDVTPDAKEISITIEGDVQALDVDVCNQVTVNGSAGRVKTGTGNVKCGDVSGNVTTNTGYIRCKSVAGSVSTNTGDIHKG